MNKIGLKKRSLPHPKESKLALKRKRSVWCPKCRRDIQQQLNSHPNEEIFLIYHQARDRKCIAKQPVEYRQRLNAVIAGFDASDEERDYDAPENWEDYDAFDVEVPEITAGEVTETNVLHVDPVQPEARRDFVIGEVQLEENRDELARIDVYKLHASEDILNLQKERIRIFEEGEFKKQFKSMRSKKGASKKKWEDILDLFSLGIDLSLSQAQGTKMLLTFLRIAERNGCADLMSIPKTWKSVAKRFKSLRKVYAKFFQKKTYEYELPEKYFGKFEKDGFTPLNKMRGMSLDVKAVLAENLLDLDPSQLSMSYCRPNDVLSGFESSNVFRKICEDDELFEAHPAHGKPSSLCISVYTDATTCNRSRTEKEQAVVLSILNAKPESYKMVFLGYAPIHKPYSDDILYSMLDSKGNIQHRQLFGSFDN